MTDRVSAGQRSENMRRIRSANTAPELIVRRLAHSMGYRYRLHRKDLPGRPDLVFGPRRKVVFVHGCFWHQHGACRAGRTPGSNAAYWTPKLQRNVERDRANIQALESDGWTVMVVWECQVKDAATLRSALTAFLQSP
jgi:DNA mismatch endonuclease (patch repair protein)